MHQPPSNKSFLYSKLFALLWLFTTNFNLSNQVAAQTLQGILLSSTQNCSQAAVQVAYQATGSFLPGNQFRLQISDTNGSFSTPITLGQNSQLSGIFNSFYPSQLQPSKAYRLRIISTNPALSFLLPDSITIFQKASLLLQPFGGSFCSNSSLVLSAEASEGSNNYQWFKDAIALTGQTSPLLEINQLALADAGAYFVRVNGCDTAYSDTVQIIVLPTQAINFDSIPSSKVVCNGSSIRLSFNANGQQPLWQWLRNGIAIPGAINTFLDIPNFSAVHQGLYQIRGLNACGLIFSDTFRLQLAQPIAVNGLPKDTLMCIGNLLQLNAEAIGQPILQYDWYKNGSFLTSTPTFDLAIPIQSVADSGYYQVHLQGQCDSIWSDTIKVQVVEAISAVVGPSNGSRCLADSISFGLAITGSWNSVNWYRLPDTVWVANGINWQLNVVQFADQGWYFAEVLGNCNRLSTDSFFLAVEPPTTILAQPSDTTICLGAVINLKPIMLGSSVQISWLKPNGSQLMADSLMISAFTLADTGIYQFSAVGSCGAINSSPFRLDLYPIPSAINLSDTLFCEGAAINLPINIALNNSDTINWLQNGVLTSQIGSNLQWPSFSVSDTGFYQPIISTPCGIDTLAGFQIGINLNPLIALAFVDTAVCAGANIELVAAGFDTATYAMQWFKNGTSVPNANNASLNVPNFSLTDIGAYQLLLSDICGNFSSDSIHLQLLSAPQLTLMPDSIKLCESQAIVFGSSANNLPFTSYELFKNQALVSTTNSLPFILNNATLSDTGHYQIYATNACGVDSTNIFWVSVSLLPQWIQAPIADSLAVCEGTTIQLIAKVDTNTASRWAWYFIDINGATSQITTADTLNITASIQNSGGYFYMASDNYCELRSDTILVSVLKQTQILQQPQSLSLCLGASDSLTVQADGNILNYQWLYNNVPLVNQTAAVLRFNSFNASLVGAYNVVVSGSCGTLVSNTARADIAPPIRLTSPVADTSVCIGEQLAFIVNSNIAPTNIQWYFNGSLQAFRTGLHFSQQISSASDAGIYQLIAGNVCSSDTFSFEVSVKQPAIFTGFMGPQSACLGANFQVEGLYNLGQSPVNSYWLFNGLQVAVGDRLILNNFNQNDTGTYQFLLVDTCGTQSFDYQLSALVPEQPVLILSNNDFCKGTPFEVEVNTTNLGTAFALFVDATLIGSNSTGRFTFFDGNNIQSGLLRVAQLGVCAPFLADSVWSNAVNLLVKPLPAAPIIQRLPNGLFEVSAMHPFVWYRNGAALPNNTPIIAPLAVGVYRAIQTDANGCKSDSSNALFQTIPFLIEEHPFDNLIIQNEYTNGKLVLNFLLRQEANVQYEVFALDGKLIMNGAWMLDVGKQQKELRLANHQNGLYFVRIAANARTQVIKWLYVYQPKP